jgi:hypothetical protein
MFRWFLIALMYASVIPLWSVTGGFLSAPNDFGFYTGVILAIGTAAYVIWTTHLLINAITIALGSGKTNSES